MNILIVGAGKSGTFLAEKLRSSHKVTVIESNQKHAAAIAAAMPEVRVIRADGCEPAVLEKAGVGSCDLVAALTGDDEDNLVVSFLSKQTHRVPLVFARTNHPRNEWMFTRDWGVDVAVSAVSLIYNLVEKEIGIGELITLMGARTGDAVIDGISVVGASRAAERTIGELDLPRRSTVMAIISGGEVVAPNGDTKLHAGDDVLILTHRDEEAAVRAAFGVTG